MPPGASADAAALLGTPKSPQPPPHARAVVTVPPWATRPDYTWRGVGVACALLGAWAATLAYALSLPLNASPLALTRAAALLALQTWLYVGLFITAHDAMHRLVAPTKPRLNHALGALCVCLYAQFDYEPLRTAHAQHHRAPASPKDPDWHNGMDASVVGWFVAFMCRYMSVRQLARIGAAAAALAALGVPLANLLLFWAAPSVLSAVQLFYYGTFLPHRDDPNGGAPHADAHRARSAAVGDAASLLTCFHFGGCHWEHHAFPAVPWWRLHVLRRALA